MKAWFTPVINQAYHGVLELCEENFQKKILMYQFIRN